MEPIYIHLESQDWWDWRDRRVVTLHYFRWSTDDASIWRLAPTPPGVSIVRLVRYDPAKHCSAGPPTEISFPSVVAGAKDC